MAAGAMGAFPVSPPVPSDAHHTSAAPAIVGPNALTPPRARGKFLYVGDDKFYILGVTYGTFRPRADGSEVPSGTPLGSSFSSTTR